MEGVNAMFVSRENYENYELSKSDILRGIVTEKLTTAAREIFAVVERTVSGYEEEAAGLRQEIDRQRIQLEAILQPRVSLCRIDEAVFEEEVFWGAEVSEEDEEQTHGEDSGTYDVFVHTEEDEGEDEFAGEALGRSCHKDKRDPDYQISSKRNPTLKKRCRKTSHLNLRVCLLPDSNADKLQRGVLKSQWKEVKCPRGLQEVDFLDLLRASFPQLTGQFDVFTMDPSKKLTPLKLQTLTPEEIQQSIRSTGKGRSALYIRVKATNEPRSSPERLPPSGTKEDADDDSRNEEERPSVSSQNSRVEGAQIVESDCLSGHSGRQRVKSEEDVEQREVSEDFSALTSAGSAADSESEDDDDRDEEWKPDIEERKPKPESSQRKQTESPLKASAETSGVPLSCRVCPALSATMNKLIKHSWSHVEDPERLCGVCGEQSETPEELRTHLESHKKTFSCDVCGKKFLSVYSLQGHSFQHTGEKPFRCDVCNKTFSFKSTLRTHQSRHTQEKPFRCEVCNKSFKFKELLRIHSRLHTGEKPYTCNLCGKSLRDLRALSRHKLFHSAGKRHDCPVCGKHFLTRGEVVRHEKSHADRNPMHLCDVCCKMFQTRGQLNAHLKTHSEEKIVCSVCGKALSSSAHMKRHMRVHSGERPFKCYKCGRTYICNGHLSFHLKFHSGVKPHVCQVCGKAFFRKEHLNNHMRTHDGEKPYKCTVCGRGFTQSHSMKTHMKRHQRGAESVGGGPTD
ncbi:zinc finger protein 3 homolog [Labrus bergylta]|uniref:zinc finger protein 3 homolog n=1 Tax=Labrus bergylta TaxID=56723 RepID=UPI003313799F